MLSQKTHKPGDRLTESVNCLSWDCGTRNLCYCLLEDCNQPDKEFSIRLWENFSLKSDTTAEAIFNLQQEFTTNFILAISHQILFISFGAFAILMYLIKNRSVSKTSTLFFLVPPVSAVMAFLFIDENLTLYNSLKRRDIKRIFTYKWKFVRDSVINNFYWFLDSITVNFYEIFNNKKIIIASAFYKVGNTDLSKGENFGINSTDSTYNASDINLKNYSTNIREIIEPCFPPT